MSRGAERCPTRVAVVAIHGVGDQAPRHTAHEVANQFLLLNNLGGPARYSPFDEQTLRITTQPVLVADRHEKAGRFRIRERSSFIRDLHRGKQRGEVEDLDVQFTKGQLAEYAPEGPDEISETVRLESNRGTPSGPGTIVHVFEMYWGDLSRIGAGVLRVLTELYQVLFEISSVGRKMVDFALVAHPDSRLWRATRVLQSWSVRVWTWSVPILNLLLLAALFSVLPAYVLENASGWQGVIAFTAAGILAFVALLRFGWRTIPINHFWVWAVIPLLILALCGGAYVLFDESLKMPAAHFGYHHLLALEWMMATGGVLAWIIALYAKRRPGALGFGLIAGMLTAAAFLWAVLKSANDRQSIVFAELRVVEMIFLALVLSWWAMIAMGLLASGTGIAAARRVTYPPERRLAWDALMTARMSLSLPIAVFMILTIGLYKGLYESTSFLVHGITYSPLIDWVRGSEPIVAAETFLKRLMDLSAPPLLTLLLISGVLVLAVWGLFPAVLTEIRTPAKRDPGSRQLGGWLTNGIRLLSWCERLLFATIFIVLPLDLFMYHKAEIKWTILGQAETAVTILGALLTIPAVGIVALRGNLQKLTAGLRPLLDVTLDVAAYLREHPRNYTPKARIYARYVSLLRHICDNGYDALVIVAHSQGTMLTTDLLRFLQKEPDPALKRMGRDMPVYLFTVGSPIRQLCGARFPHLFAWATRDTDYATPPKSEPNDLRHDAGADPAALGVKCWVNAYRSADYIGRFLWRPENCAYNWDPPSGKPPGDTRPWNPLLEKPVNVSESVHNGTERPRVELCLGAGAHMHYFDQRDTDVAVLLDLLIDRAAVGKTL